MSNLPCRPPAPAPKLAAPGTLLRLLLFLLFLLAATAGARAELYQYIGVNVMSPQKFRMDRIEYPLAEMTQQVKARVKGPDRIHVKLFIPISIEKEVIEQIKDYCRKAGATSFFIVRKS